MDEKLCERNSINFIKVISMYLVIMVHSANVLSYAAIEETDITARVLVPFRVIASFAVPLFFIVSGYLLFIKRFDYLTNMKKKIRTLFVPFLFWNAVWMLFEYIAGNFVPGVFEDFSKWTLEDVILSLSFRPFYSPFWFLWWLFLMNILSGIIRKILEKNQIILIALVLVVWHIPLQAEYVIRARQSFCFFVVGALIASNKELLYILFEKYRKQVFVISVAIICMVLLGNLLLGHVVVKMCMQMIGVLGTFIFLVCICKKMNIRFVDKLVSHSFIVYAVHGKILSVLQIVATKMIHQEGIVVIVEYFVLPIFAFALSMGISVAYKKILPSIYKFSIGGR